MRILAAIFLAILGLINPAHANVTCSLPFQLTNGTVADASQVMANYNALITCLTNAAAAGANNDITSLTALTSPIGPTAGGSNVFIGVSPTQSGSNIGIASTIPSGFTNTTGYSVYFIATAANTSVQTVSVAGQAKKNIFKPTAAGPIALTGAEIQSGNLVYMTYDGTQFQLFSTNGLASLSATGQNLTGGVHVSTFSAGTFSGGGTFSVDCGNGPLQSFSNNGNMTIAAPTSDGTCVLEQTNTGSAGTVAFSGFNVSANVGEPLTTTNGNVFFITIARINGTSTYMVKALQ